MNEPLAEETIFAATLELPPVERAAYLDQAVGCNIALRQRIEALLNASEQSGHFLEESAAPNIRPTRVVTSALAEKPGDRIGRYKLLQQIGEGGCGVVYMAEQEEPVRRKVALKVIKLGMDTRQVIARFEAERQALALMDHPNIATVLDVGATETGRPFFVMELVRGLKITDYCDQNNLATRERLEMFMQVCRAIEHAHQKGIIHRDIKPSNIMVTLHDGVPVPKVIDFGIAKATQGRLTDRTIFTAFEQFIGTPAYMSPEQAELSGLDIDTRSDIYSLGVLLYELLTGKTPFDPKELLAAGLEAMRRTIREMEPDRPSTRLSTMIEGDLSSTAAHRRTESPKLVSAVRGDLDWIVMKCLEKDRTRRYETANGLTSEIQRHLNQEPVLACPPSRLYRFQKTFRRNKLAVTAATAVTAALIIGTGTTTSMFLKERQAKVRAIAAEQVERRLRQQAEMRELDARANELDYEGSRPAAEAARRKAVEAKRKLLGADHPDVAVALYQLAQTLRDEGSPPEEEKVLREALVILKKSASQIDPRTALVLCHLGRVLGDEGKVAEEEQIYREALERRAPVLGSDRADVVLLDSLARFLDYQNRPDEAFPYERQALAIARKLTGDGNRDVAMEAANVIAQLVESEQYSEAEGFIRDVVPPNLKAWPNLSSAVSWLAAKFLDSGRYDDAEKLFTDLLIKTPESIELLRERAQFRARNHRFDGALSDYSRLLELKPDDSTLWSSKAAILAYTGQIQEHREHCREFLERFGESTEPRALDRAGKNALLLPEAGENFELALMAIDAIHVKSGDPNNKPWFELSKGLGEYRRDHFDKALEYLQEVVVSDNAPRSCEAMAYAVSAMAQYRLRHADQAMAALTRASAWEEWTKSKRFISEEWDDWLRAFLLTHEAKALIGQTVSANPLSSERLNPTP